MAESAYHNEALRKQRLIERKRDAQVRLLDGPQVTTLFTFAGLDCFIRDWYGIESVRSQSHATAIRSQGSGLQ